MENDLYYALYLSDIDAAWWEPHESYESMQESMFEFLDDLCIKSDEKIREYIKNMKEGDTFNLSDFGYDEVARFKIEEYKVKLDDNRFDSISN